MHRSERFKSLREKCKLLFCSTKKNAQLLVMEAYPMTKRRQNKNTNKQTKKTLYVDHTCWSSSSSSSSLLLLLLLLLLFYFSHVHSTANVILPFVIDLDRSFSRGSCPQPLAQQSSSLSTELEGRWSHKSQKSQRLTLVPNLCRRGRRRNKGIVMSCLND